MILTPQQKLIYTLRHTHHLSQREIATRVGIQQPQVSRILGRAKRRLLDFRSQCPPDRCSLAEIVEAAIA
jgi:RNA polymerase sigma factor (sigma-70 family)